MKKHIDLNNKTILVTGGAGFIGSHLILRLLKELKSGTIINIDNMNNYYDTKLKDYRLAQIDEAAKTASANYVFIKGNIADNNLLRNTFTNYKPSIVVNLAAQSGIDYSIDHPDTYLEYNIIGFYGILQSCRYSKVASQAGVEHLVYASTSDVYDGNRDATLSTDDRTDRPASLYAATKKTNELLAYSYSQMYNIATTGLRIFPVYGPVGRPDMSYYSDYNKLTENDTYIDDVVEGIYRVMQGAPETETGEGGKKVAPYSLYNIGGGDTKSFEEDYGSIPKTDLETGIKNTLKWNRYY